ncbi:hyalin-like isoform X4 [Antedon mediterranea]|uniref:hyalin-like isoform X4 n=1 Tax=Antedon mediterranea TaxID=105859 RepID=UPI003AF68E35
MDERYIALMLVLLFKQCQICSSQSPCSSNPCLNNGNCYVNTNNTYRCSCRTGYKGDRCEYPAFVKGYVSTGKPAYQSATYSSGGISYDAGLAVDGNGNQDFSIGSCSRTVVSVNQNPYWYIDLGSLHIIERVYVYTPYGYEDASNQLGSIDYLSTSYSWYPDVIGRFVFLFQKKSNAITVCEVYVYGIPTLIPVVTCPGDIDIIGTSSSRVSWDAPTVVDDVDTGLTATCTSSSGSYFPVGSTTVTCTATDSDANTGQCTFTIQLLLEDNEMPIVVCRNDISTSSSSFRQYTWNDPTVSDNIDTGLSANCTPPSGSSFNGGSVTHVTCNATDSAGNTGSCQFTLTVLDTGNPTVTCPSNIVRNSHTDQTTVTWIASVQDYGDPDLSADCIPPSGSSFRLGSTDVICTDRAGNIGICAFKITVNHNNNPYENPNVVCPDDVIRITTSDRVTVTWDDPSVTDNVDTGLSATCTPSSGSSFNIGSTDVTCFATDSVGNYGSCNLKVIVIDIDAPIVTCPFNMEEDTDGGQATVTWSDPSVTDNVDSGLSATCTPSSGSLFNIGSTDVACTAMDTDGKTGSCKFTVSVNDAGDPTVTCPDNIEVYTDQVTWDDPSVSDNFDTGLPATCTPSSGSLFNAGSTDVTCNATDTAGNTGSCGFTVAVEFDTTYQDSAGCSIIPRRTK